MKPKDRSEQKLPVSKVKRLRSWLFGSVLTLLFLGLVALFFAPYLIDTDTFKQNIRSLVTDQTGGQVEYQSLDLAYWPRPAIELRQVTMDVPALIKVRVEVVRIVPELLPLLTGDLHLAQIKLDAPELALVQTETKPSASATPFYSFDSLKQRLAATLSPLGQMATELTLLVSDATLSVVRGKEKLVANGLTLRLELRASEPDTASATLQGGLSELNIHHDSSLETIKDIKLNGRVLLRHDEIKLSIERLAVSQPSLELSGTMTMSPMSPGLTVDLSGAEIDVDAVRRTALALAGDTSPTREIFDYLRGGRLQQLSFTSRGETPSDLGDLGNMLIKGHLQGGKVSIPEIRLDLTEVIGDVVISDGVLQGSGMSTRLEGSSGQDGILKVGLAEGNQLFQLELMLNADLAQTQRILKRIVENHAFGEEIDKITDLQGSGVGKLVLGDSLTNIIATVDASELDFTAAHQEVPFPIKVSRGQVSFAENLIGLKGWDGSLGNSSFRGLDCRLSLSDGSKGQTGHLERVELALDGDLDQSVSSWLMETLEVPAAYSMRTPLSLSSFSLDWQSDGSATFKGSLSISEGPGLTLDGSYQPDQLTIHNLTVKDQYSDADLALSFAPSGLSLGFNGTLRHETLATLFLGQTFGKGSLEGDFSVKTNGTVDTPASAQGHLQGSNLLLPLPSGEQVAIEQMALDADGQLLNVDLRSLSWKKFRWDPVKGTVDFSQDRTRATLKEAKLCGIDSPGVIVMEGDDFLLDLKLGGEELDLASSYTCLTQGRVKMTGVMAFSSSISAKGKADELIRTMQGPLEVTFKNGVIEEGKTLNRVLEVLNVTEIVKGRLPDLGSTGFAYQTITLQGEFREGKLLIEKFYMDGKTLDLIGYGQVDMEEKSVILELLAAPFKTVDTVVKNIPGVNYLLAGSLVTIPVSIKGELADPKVAVMSSSAVSNSLLNLGTRVIKSPLKLIETLTPGRKGQED